MATTNKKVKVIEQHKVTQEELAASPEMAAAGAKEGDTVQISEEVIEEDPDPVPAYTLRAATPFGVRAMAMVRDLALSMSHPDKAAIARSFREFDLYEEAHRR